MIDTSKAEYHDISISITSTSRPYSPADRMIEDVRRVRWVCEKSVFARHADYLSASDSIAQKVCRLRCA